MQICVMNRLERKKEENAHKSQLHWKKTDVGFIVK